MPRKKDALLKSVFFARRAKEPYCTALPHTVSRESLKEVREHVICGIVRKAHMAGTGISGSGAAALRHAWCAARCEGGAAVRHDSVVGLWQLRISGVSRRLHGQKGRGRGGTLKRLAAGMGMALKVEFVPLQP